jgi:outer membrane protein assembly factor BamB
MQNVKGKPPLQLWPALVIVAVALIGYGVSWVTPDTEVGGFPLKLAGLLGGVVGALAILIWWMFFSRASWPERIGVLALMAGALLMTRLVIHESIAGAGMGLLIYTLALPGLCLALVVWAVVAQRFSPAMRRAVLVVVMLLACVPWMLLRTAGTKGSGSEFHWRWTPTPEQLLLAQANDEPQPLLAATSEVATASPTATPANPSAVVLATPSAVTATVSSSAEWPGFRGANRDGVVRGVKINTDWTAAPPVELWRKPIGPGWSSFAVRGDLLYTQEQRGEDEIVGCYKVSTGEPVWRYRDAVRFWESNGGAGPRATPTLHGNRVYAFGATGILNALEASTGQLVWSRNVATDTKRKVPTWGFASSPLVVDDLVIVAAASTLAAYNRMDGKPRWQGPAYDGGYSSPHLVTIDGIQQVVLLGGLGAISVAPATGAVLWEHKWESGSIVQPAVTPDGDILVNAIAATGGLGLRRLHAKQEAGHWTLAERWTSNGLKPNFNDFVLHQGHAYGFDNNILSCINLEDGKRQWKGGRYGNGQLVLLPEQNVLLVISEEGELALVSATTDQFKELARTRALDGKTWNHPAVVNDVLLVRNGAEMAAFRLPR